MKQRRYHRIFSMKRLIPAFAIVLGCASAAWAAAPATLTTLSAIHALTNVEAHQAIPVVFEATVTYFRGYARTLFVQDGDAAIFVLVSLDAKLTPGDRVLVRGTTRDSFHPIVISNSVTLLQHGALPKSVPASYNELIRAQHDGMLVTVHAVVRSADLRGSSDTRSIYLQMLTDGGYIDADVLSGDASVLKDLLDAEVEVTGAAAGNFDNKMQQTGVLLHVSSMADVKILKPAGSSPWSLPVTPMDTIVAGYRMRDLTARIRVHGTITYYQPGVAVVLQDGAKSLWIATQTRSPLTIGDLADATGFPDVHDGFLNLARGEIQDSRVQAPIVPLSATWQSLTLNGNTYIGHIYDLVSIEGQVMTEAREASRDEYVLSSDGHLFTAIYYHSDQTSLIPLPPMKQIPLGATVRVSGICILENSDPFNGPVPFNILLRSYDDIAVVSRPSWLNIRNLMLIVSLLLLVVIAVGAWGATLNRKVRTQTAALAARIEAEAAFVRRMAQLEQRRSLILEDINGSRPLAEILEEITELVSFRLEGVCCWCEVTDGARLGNYPPAQESLRVVSEQIPARAGSPLGVLFAGFEPGTHPAAAETEALSVGARLATLAIETRRLYSDLRHRSDFDLLTDVHNRFSLDKYLDRQIDEARRNAGLFGLIYIDLDEFKQVNDLYGHQVGDLYLQEVALRMKRQLRNVDMLARLGGDEFAVLVPVVRNRAAAEEIAQRLERSFDEPFAIEGFVLHGSASVGVALYPQDAVTKDSLLSFADAAMYVAKNTKRQIGQVPAGNQNPELTPKNQT
jgi:diguanylate cyclase (GGDEF)-like protein